MARTVPPQGGIAASRQVVGLDFCPLTEIPDAAPALQMLLGAGLFRFALLLSGSRRKVWESECGIGATFLSGWRGMGREKDSWPFLGNLSRH